jgi:uncharacterized protein (TIGR02452 family)
MTRAQRRATARQTLDILNAGSYLSSEGKTVSIRDALKYAVANSVHYRPEMSADLAEKPVLGQRPHPETGDTVFQVVNQRTLDAARRLVLEESHSGVLCLNFGSAKRPGGGFLSGSEAQEESLARCSGLYACLARMKGMYKANRALKSSLYTDDMIYSPMVPVFRSSDDELLESAYSVSIITAPAPNAGAVRDNEPNNVDKVGKVLLNRAGKVLAVARAHGETCLVLGAWGCGVFRNDPGMVASVFHAHLTGEGEYAGVFRKAVFAVWDVSSSRRNITPFRRLFDTRYR